MACKAALEQPQVGIAHGMDERCLARIPACNQLPICADTSCRRCTAAPASRTAFSEPSMFFFKSMPQRTPRATADLIGRVGSEGSRRDMSSDHFGSAKTVGARRRRSPRCLRKQDPCSRTRRQRRSRGLPVSMAARGQPRLFARPDSASASQTALLARPGLARRARCCG